MDVDQCPKSLREGERVEVRQKDVGLRGSWHPATIVGSKAGRRLVEYDELLTDDGLSKLRESIPCAKIIEKPTCQAGVCTSMKSTLLATLTRSPSKRRGLLRPSPPVCTEPSPLTWKSGLFVDVFYQDAWWEAVLLSDVASLDDNALIDVIYPDEGDLARVHAKDLRISQCWDEVTGQWSIKGSTDLSRFLKRRGLGRKEVDVTVESVCKDNEGGVFSMQGDSEREPNQICASSVERRGDDIAPTPVTTRDFAGVASSGKGKSEGSLLHAHQHVKLSDYFSTDQLKCPRNGVLSSPCPSGSHWLEDSKGGTNEEVTYESMHCDSDMKAVDAEKELIEKEDIRLTSAPLVMEHENLQFKRRRIGEAGCGRGVNFSGPQPSCSTPAQYQHSANFKLIQEEPRERLHKGSRSHRHTTSRRGQSLGRARNCNSILRFQKEHTEQLLGSEESDFIKGKESISFNRDNLDCKKSSGRESKLTNYRDAPKIHLLALEAPVMVTQKDSEKAVGGEKTIIKGVVHERATRPGKTVVEREGCERAVRSVKAIIEGDVGQRAVRSGQATVEGKGYERAVRSVKAIIEGDVGQRAVRPGQAIVEERCKRAVRSGKTIVEVDVRERSVRSGKAIVEGGAGERAATSGRQAPVYKNERRGGKDTLRSFKDRLVRQRQAEALKRKASEMSAKSGMGEKNVRTGGMGSTTLRKLDQSEISTKSRVVETRVKKGDIVSKPYSGPNQPETSTSWLSNFQERSLKGLAREIGIKAILEAGYTIELKPRRGSLSHDAVYTSPKGCSYWSLPKAWKALKGEERKGWIRVEKAVLEQVFSKVENDEKLLSALKKVDRFSGTCFQDVIQQTDLTYAELTNVLIEDLGVLRKNMPKFKGRKKSDEKNPGKKSRKINQKPSFIMNNDGDSKTSRLPFDSFMDKKRRNRKVTEAVPLMVDGRMTNSKISVRSKHLQVGSVVKVEDRPLMKQGSARTLKIANRAQCKAGNSLASIEKNKISMKGSSKSHVGEVRGFKQESSRKKEKKLQSRSGFRLEVRPSASSMDDESEDVSSISKRTVVSWMIDRGAVLEKERIFYVDQLSNQVLKEGVVTREGITCRCCKKIYTIQGFEEHGGIQEDKLHQNLVFTSGRSFLDCQLEAWKVETQLHRTHKLMGVTADDTNDDSCLLCGDGGDLICCDLCPSTFHASCLQINDVPEGKWYCPKCRCGICKVRQHGQEEERSMAVCNQCEHRYHIACLCGGYVITKKEFFCGPLCRKIFSGLRELVGVTHSLERGFSWTLLRCMEEDNGAQLKDINSAMYNNSKLAVALLVLKECFNPMDDPRTNIDMITHAVCNRWSQFDRLNYVGFYTAVLEREDEIVSVASIRIHGARLAEMPLIGTRHKYRRQGMCRLLVGVIEKLLCSLEVATFILPAIPELFETWTQAFGFRPLDASQRSGIKDLSMMMFPGTELLQKPMLQSLIGNALQLDKHDDAISVNVCQMFQNTNPFMMTNNGTGLLHNAQSESARGEHADLELSQNDDSFLNACQDSSMMAEGAIGPEGVVSEVAMSNCPEGVVSEVAKGSVFGPRNDGPVYSRAEKLTPNPVQVGLTSFGDGVLPTVEGFSIDDGSQNLKPSSVCMQSGALPGAGAFWPAENAEGPLVDAINDGSQKLLPSSARSGGAGSFALGSTFNEVANTGAQNLEMEAYSISKGDSGLQNAEGFVMCPRECGKKKQSDAFHMQNDGSLTMHSEARDDGSQKSEPAANPLQVNLTSWNGDSSSWIAEGLSVKITNGLLQKR